MSRSKTAAPSFGANLSWSHYLMLLRVDNPTARAFYEIEATRTRMDRGCP